MTRDVWSADSEQLPGGRGIKLRLREGSRPLTWSDVLTLWEQEPAFRSWFNEALAGSPFTAFRWECPALTDGDLGALFECVLIEDRHLNRRADRKPFAERFAEAEAAVIAFPNLRGDSRMIVPVPVGSDRDYAHIGAFVRRAPDEQRDELWRVVATELLASLGAEPVWLSTAGAGVAWLHVRIDGRPKYYSHRPYRDR